jgi:TRAP-type C4-dicarboxylate transport system permease small subunit
MKKHLDNIEAYICAFLFLSMTAVGFANVVVRYLTSYSFAATQELLLSGFLLLTIFGAALAARRGQHLAVTFFTDLIGQPFERWARVFAAIVSTVLLLLAAWFCFDLVRNQLASGVTTPGLQLPAWYYSAGLPIGFILIAIRTVEYAYRDFHNHLPEETLNV